MHTARGRRSRLLADALGVGLLAVVAGAVAYAAEVAFVLSYLAFVLLVQFASPTVPVAKWPRWLLRLLVATTLTVSLVLARHVYLVVST